MECPDLEYGKQCYVGPEICGSGYTICWRPIPTSIYVIYYMDDILPVHKNEALLETYKQL